MLERLAEILDRGGVDALLEQCGEVVGDDAVIAALRHAAPSLRERPAELPAQLLARLVDDDGEAARLLRAEAMGWDRGTWLRPLVPSLRAPSGPLVATLPGSDDEIAAVAISGDGRHVVAGATPRTARCWDRHGSGEAQVFRGYGRYGPGEGYGEEVTGAGITDDGTLVALASRDGGVHVWRAADGSLVCTAGGESGDDEDWLTSIAPGARRAASAFESSIVPVVADAQRGVVRVLDLRSGDVVHTVEGSTRAGAAAVSTDGGALVVASDGLARHDLRSGDVARAAGPSGVRGALAVSGDGTLAATGHDDGTLAIWDLAGSTGSEARTGHRGPVRAVALSADGATAVSGSDDGDVRVWDLREQGPSRRLAGHVGAVRAVAISPDGRWAVSGGADRVVRVWDLADTGSTGPARRQLVREVRLSSNGGRAVAVSADGTEEVWELDAGDAGEPRERRPVPPEVRAQVADLESREGGSNGDVSVVDVSGDGQRAICTSRAMSVLSAHHRWSVDQSTVRVWHLGRRPRGRVLDQRTTNVVGGQRGPAFADAAISDDGRRGVAVGDDGVITVWDLDTAAACGTFAADGPLTTCAISADGGTVAAAGGAGDVHLLRVVERR